MRNKSPSVEDFSAYILSALSMLQNTVPLFKKNVKALLLGCCYEGVT